MMDRLKKLLIISVVHASLMGMTVDQANAVLPESDANIDLHQGEHSHLAQLETSASTPTGQQSSLNWQIIGGWLVLAGVPAVVIGAAWYAIRRPPQASGGAEASKSALHPAASLPVAAQVTESEKSEVRSAGPLPDHAAQVNLPPSETTRLAKVDIVETLIADLQHPDRTKRGQAIWELGQRGDSRAVQPLVDSLVAADSQQRSLILAAIAEISARTLKPIHHALVLSLQDASADVRKNAIRDVTRIYASMNQMSQLLQYAAADTDLEVQETAQWALSQLNRLHPLVEMRPVHTVEKSLDQNTMQ